MMNQPTSVEFTPNSIPGCVMWLSAKGKSNTDSDRGTLKDLSGNGNDAVLRNFGFVEGSGYDQNALVFDGVDDLCVIDNLKQLNDFTFFAKRKILSVANGYYPGMFGNDGNSFEYGVGGITHVRSVGTPSSIGKSVPALVSYMTPTSYNGLKISKGTVSSSGKPSVIGNYSLQHGSVINMILYELIAYDRTLEIEEINKIIEFLNNR